MTCWICQFCGKLPISRWFQSQETFDDLWLQNVQISKICDNFYDSSYLHHLSCTVHDDCKLQYPKKSQIRKKQILKHLNFFFQRAIYFSIANSVVCSFKRIKVTVCSIVTKCQFFTQYSVERKNVRSFEVNFFSFYTQKVHILI